MFALSKSFLPAMNHSLTATGDTDSVVINVDWLRTRVSFIHVIAMRSCTCTLTCANSLFFSFATPYSSFFFIHETVTETEAPLRLFTPACVRLFVVLKEL